MTSYNIYFLAEVTVGSNNPNFEVLEAGLFDFNDLPELSTKTTIEELTIIYQYHLDNKDSYFE